MKRKYTAVSDQEIIDACEQHDFMSEAASHLGIHKNTLKSRAIQLGVYKPASHDKISERGGSATREKLQYELSDILDGKHPQYPTFLLSKRLVKENVLDYACTGCNISEWNDKPISLELPS